MAVLDVVAHAFRGTGSADFGARFANRVGELTAAGHHHRGTSAELGAVHDEADAARHGPGIFTIETCDGTSIA
jgi:hypothetical protein